LGISKLQIDRIGGIIYRALREPSIYLSPEDKSTVAHLSNRGGLTPCVRFVEDPTTFSELVLSPEELRGLSHLMARSASALGVPLFNLQGGIPLLHELARSQISTASLMAKDFLDVDSTLVHRIDSEGRTPLHIAAKHGSPLASLFLKYRANPHASDMRGVMPLHLAAINRHTYVCEELVKAGADPLATDEAEATAIEYSIRGHKESKTISPELILFLQRVTGLSIFKEGVTPLHAACLYGRSINLVELFINNEGMGALGDKDAKGKTPWDYAMGSTSGLIQWYFQTRYLVAQALGEDLK